MTKKILALVLALVMVFAMTACTSTEEPAESPAATDDAGTESTEPTASAGSGEVVNLLYYEIGNQDTNSREAVQEAINAYIEPLIGANIEFRIVSWADWDSRRADRSAVRRGDRPVLHRRLEAVHSLGHAGPVHAPQ